MSIRSRSDEVLVRDCLAGNETAWGALIDRYKNLIYSVPIKLGVSREESADIFQAVCLELFSNLASVREPNALPKWLIRVAYRKALQWKQGDDRFSPLDSDQDPAGTSPEIPNDLLISAQNEQFLRDAMAALSERCQQMIHMLFFESPARPYNEVAKELGLAIGSIGFIRGRCLKSLRKSLEQKGFR